MYKANDGFVKTFKNLCYVIAKSFLDEALRGCDYGRKMISKLAYPQLYLCAIRSTQDGQ